MQGRLEKELKAQEKMNNKLKGFPEIFKNYYLYLRAAGKSAGTIDTYMSGIIRFANTVCSGKIDDEFYKNIKVGDIEGYLISLETTQKSGQITRMSSDNKCAIWSYLNGFWNFLLKRDYIKENIVGKTNRPKNNNEHSVTYLNKSEIAKLLKTIDKNKDIVARIRDKAIISIGLATGLRCSAIMNLNIDEIDFINNHMNVIEKENKSRVVNFGSQLASVLQEWISVREKEYGFVKTNALFISQKLTRMSTDAANDMLRKYGKEASINKKLTMHKLRSSTATNLAASGVSIQAISKQLGHSSTAVTMRYVEVLNEEKKQAVNILDKLI